MNFINTMTASGAGFGAVEPGHATPAGVMRLALVWAILIPSQYLLVDPFRETEVRP